ncbi:hypothetical protein ANCCAN_03638 [Ancylostoma caninum]|uniref:Uncharacterized protein n=1 Tax=Ancylostoma caninum TaxID=29170 RepID=A0A368H0R7_ANCCA|nr:hypothetical protein ANCCAN_03638 [Ancylostoma caninum]
MSGSHRKKTNITIRVNLAFRQSVILLIIRGKAFAGIRRGAVLSVRAPRHGLTDSTKLRRQTRSLRRRT